MSFSRHHLLVLFIHFDAPLQGGVPSWEHVCFLFDKFVFSVGVFFGRLFPLIFMLELLLWLSKLETFMSTSAVLTVQAWPMGRRWLAGQ